MFASKTRLCLFLAAGVLTTLAASSARQAASMPEQAYSSSVVAETKHSSADFVPDGDLAKSAWKQANWLEFDNDASGKSHYPEVATRVTSLWTETYVYFAFSGRYEALNIYEGEDPNPERWQLWDRDVVEVFLNPQPGR